MTEQHIHPSHRMKFSWTSTRYDEICVLCGATDETGDRRLEHKCPKSLSASGKGNLAEMMSEAHAELEADDDGI